MAEKTQVLRIKRQESPNSEPYYEEFEIPYLAHHNIISMLMEIRRNPVTRQGKRVAPVVFDANCLEEVCGSCTMVINGRVRQGCSQLAEDLNGPVTVEPMSKFPVIRDLWVDRSKMFEALEEGACVDSDRRHLRSRRGPANGAEHAGVRVPVLAMHDVRMLPRGMPAD